MNFWIQFLFLFQAFNFYTKKEFFLITLNDLVNEHMCNELFDNQNSDPPNDNDIIHSKHIQNSINTTRRTDVNMGYSKCTRYMYDFPSSKRKYVCCERSNNSLLVIDMTIASLTHVVKNLVLHSP